jgi:alpha-L-fucosidase
LWPSQYSTHTVRESAWRNGKGDVLRELSDACAEYGLKFGVYLSPWDRNHPTYGTPGYNQTFVNMLKEVLGNYGPVYEQWFDGACGEGPNGKQQVYDWPLFNKTVYTLQPNAVIFSDVGPGCRWMGNEQGIAGETNWSKLDIEGFTPGIGAPDTKVLNTGNSAGVHWIPGEIDTSIRPGWFYSPETDDQVKSVNELTDIYYTSIGRNANLLLNVPPDTQGRIHPNDSIRLMEFRQHIEAVFADNLIKDAVVKATNVRHLSEKYNPAVALVDDNYDSYWATDDNITQAGLIFEWDVPKTFNRLLLQEYIPLGQRVKSFSLEYWDGQKWKLIDRQTTIGYKRILRFPTVTSDKIRINIEAPACPILNEIGLYNAPED